MPARPWKCLLVACACLVAACNGELERVAAASRELAGELAAADAPRGPANGQGTAPAGGETRLYVDASRSMAGFVGCSQTATEFDQVLDRMANDLGITTVRMFGQPSGGGALVEERPLDRAVHCPDAFRRLQNPDYELYRLMEADSGAGVNVYFSDGVQSATSAATPSPSVAALQRWLASGRALAILAFRSRFAGEAWSEQRGGWMGRVEVADRPFYVFFLGPGEAALDEALGRLSPSLKPLAILRFPADPFACGIRRRLLVQTETSDPPWGLVPPSVHGQMVTQPAHVADYECTLRDGFPLRAVEATVRAEFRRWDGTKFGDGAALPQGAAFTLQPPAVSEGKSVAALQGTVPRDQPGTLYGFYHLRFTPRPGPLRPELEALSTESDADRGQFNRTYRFSWMVEHLVRTQFARAPRPASLFLTIQDGG